MKSLFTKLITFLIKKKVQTATGEMTEVSKTKLFITIEGIIRLVEFVSPYFGHPVTIPTEVHQALYGLAGLSYAERQIKK